MYLLINGAERLSEKSIGFIVLISPLKYNKSIELQNKNVFNISKFYT
jgi:hypothetical protein